MVTHVPFVSPFLCSVTHATGWVATLLWPLCYVWARLAQLLLPATVMQRYQYRGTQVATWCLPVAARFYLNKGERPAIQRKLEAAVDAAERAGVRYVGLAALNKAEANAASARAAAATRRRSSTRRRRPPCSRQCGEDAARRRWPRAPRPRSGARSPSRSRAAATRSSA